ncbi:MAG: hypothetical protein MUP47_01990 [Phycisphaerae bacterium]|nr:hypothetical protein [Phycisphaerae bacterium]
MNLPIRNLRPARAAWLGLVGAAALLSVLSLASLASRPKAHDELLGLLEEVRAPQEAGARAPASAYRPRGAATARADTQTVEQVSKRNMFAPPAGPKKPPAPIAVLGDQAVFPNNEWVKVGGEYQGCKLLATGPDWVELEVDGKPLRLSVFAPREAGASQGQAGQLTPGQPQPSEDRRDRGRFFGDRPFVVTPEMIERFRSMPPDRRERMLENMPPEIRQQIEQQ